MKPFKEQLSRHSQWLFLKYQIHCIWLCCIHRMARQENVEFDHPSTHSLRQWPVYVQIQPLQCIRHSCCSNKQVPEEILTVIIPLLTSSGLSKLVIGLDKFGTIDLTQPFYFQLTGRQAISYWHGLVSSAATVVIYNFSSLFFSETTAPNTSKLYIQLPYIGVYKIFDPIVDVDFIGL